MMASITDCVSADVRGEAEETAGKARERCSTDEPAKDHSAADIFQYQPLEHPQAVRGQRTNENRAAGIP